MDLNKAILDDLVDRWTIYQKGPEMVEWTGLALSSTNRFVVWKG